jgi:hypothetical protein
MRSVLKPSPRTRDGIAPAPESQRLSMAAYLEHLLHTYGYAAIVAVIALAFGLTLMNVTIPALARERPKLES